MDLKGILTIILLAYSAECSSFGGNKKGEAPNPAAQPAEAVSAPSGGSAEASSGNNGPTGDGEVTEPFPDPWLEYETLLAKDSLTEEEEKKLEDKSNSLEDRELHLCLYLQAYCMRQNPETLEEINELKQLREKRCRIADKLGGKILDANSLVDLIKSSFSPAQTTASSSSRAAPASGATSGDPSNDASNNNVAVAAE